MNLDIRIMMKNGSNLLTQITPLVIAKAITSCNKYNFIKYLYKKSHNFFIEYNILRIYFYNYYDNYKIIFYKIFHHNSYIEIH